MGGATARGISNRHGESGCSACARDSINGALRWIQAKPRRQGTGSDLPMIGCGATGNVKSRRVRDPFSCFRKTGARHRHGGGRSCGGCHADHSDTALPRIGLAGRSHLDRNSYIHIRRSEKSGGCDRSRRGRPSHPRIAGVGNTCGELMARSRRHRKGSRRNGYLHRRRSYLRKFHRKGTLFHTLRSARVVQNSNHECI